LVQLIFLSEALGGKGKISSFQSLAQKGLVTTTQKNLTQQQQQYRHNKNIVSLNGLSLSFVYD